ncbi:MAG: argininosuccinate synthase [Xanthomonadales bacterium]|nr:argininosuccinate synthase [Xanthomonadales bacterium]
MSEKLVLAFSGGLDTSYCLLKLVNEGFEVHSVFVDTGGVDDAERSYIEQRAADLGATRHHTIQGGQDLWDEFVRPLVWSGARIHEQYPMLCSDRYLIVRKSLELCDELGTKLFAHGCTGMGNDQLRFDQTVRSLGDYQIIAPIRDLQAQTDKVRDYEIELLREAGHEVRASNSAYSINENLLGVTTSGSEIDEFDSPGAGAWTLTRPRSEWPEGSHQVKVGFEQGVAVSLDGRAVAGPEIIQRLNQAFGAYGVGRHIYTGDVSIGLKGRIVFECPAVDALLVAHRALEESTNTRLQNQFKHLVSQRWAELVYTGFFYEPHKFDLEAYLESSQRAVNGTVTLETSGGSVYATAIESRHILQDPESIYAQSASWTPEEAAGFIKLLGQSSTLSAKINGVVGRE